MGNEWSNILPKSSREEKATMDPKQLLSVLPIEAINIIAKPITCLTITWETSTRNGSGYSLWAKCCNFTACGKAYRTSHIKMLVAWRVLGQDNAWLTTKFGTFSNWRSQHWSTPNILDLPTIILHWYHLFPVLLLFCCNYLNFFNIFFNKLKLKSCIVCLVLSALCSFKPQWKKVAFPQTICNDWSNCEQLENH